MDCPVICVRHGEDGEKYLLMEVPPGDPRATELRLGILTATKLAQELTSPQCDGGWARIPVR